MEVAVIGAGAAGLASCRELLREKHQVTVFEKSDNPGGIWVYETKTDTDLTGRSPQVFSSLYASLRTNLPRDLMAFTDYPFDSAGGGDDNWPRYPHHTKVLEYLQRFARDHNLEECLELNTEVTEVKPLTDNRWQVIAQGTERVFDAVVVCNGHYSKPKLPNLPGIDQFLGQVIHSHNYRTPDPFLDKNICLWGSAASGSDISRELAKTANRVYWCGSAFTKRLQNDAGVTCLPPPVAVTGNTIETAAGAIEDIDVFMYCTGYQYEFPFLAEGIVSVDDNRVSPLYLDILPIGFPTLAFIGIPYLIVPFPLFSRQATWFARLLNKQFSLPDETDMLQWITSKESASDGIARHYHRLGPLQAEYLAEISALCSAEPVPQWFHDLAAEAQSARLANPGKFRDSPLNQRGPTRVSDSDQPPP